MPLLKFCAVTGLSPFSIARQPHSQRADRGRVAFLLFDCVFFHGVPSLAGQWHCATGVRGRSLMGGGNVGHRAS